MPFQGQGLALLFPRYRTARQATTTHVRIAQPTMDSVPARLFPPGQRAIQKHTNASSREPTGGQARCEAVMAPDEKGSAERGNALQSGGQANVSSAIHHTLAALREEEESRHLDAQKKAGQRGRASLAWSYSNPAHDAHVMSMASSCSTALPAPVSSCRRSQMRTPQEQAQAQPPELI